VAVKDIDSLTIDDIKPITISFKKTEDELILYKWVLNHSNYSGFVKDTLRDVKDGAGGANNNKTVMQEAKGTGLIDMDF
jgi:hypothetical protein